MKAGWQTSTLGEVTSFLNRGISPKYLEADGICVLNQKCIRDHRINFVPSRRHDEQAKKVGKERFIRVGDVLVNSTGTGTLGRVAQLREAPPEPTTVDSHVTIVRPSPGKFYSEFFGYMMVIIEDAIKKAGEGCGGQTELARSVLADKFFVHYPESLSEQRRIAGILDEAFDGIATARANAEKNLQNARALFVSHLEAVFSQLGEGWEEKPLEAVASIINGFAFKSTDFSSEEGVKCIKITNVGVGEFVCESGVYLPSSFSAAYEAVSVKKGSIVLALTRTIISGGLKVAIVPGTYDGALLNQRVASILSKPLLLSMPFLFYYLSTQTVADYVTARVNTLMQPNLSIKDLRALPIPLPAIQEQVKIADQLLELSEETQRLESLYQRKLVALDELKQSLLNQAFTGQI